MADAHDLLDELRNVADRRPELLRERIAELPDEDAAGALLAFVALDASRRAADALAADGPAPPATPAAFAAALDDAKRLGHALDRLDSWDAVVAAVFDALAPAEARMVLFERALRALVERRRREHGGGGSA